MLLFDNHNHSQFSFDGKRTSVEAAAMEAVAKGLKGLAFTDHCDFFIPEEKKSQDGNMTEVFDVIPQQNEISETERMIAQRHQTPDFRILKGAEIGMNRSCREEIRKWMSSYDFDQVIASVHYLDGTDPFYGDYYEGKDWKEAYGHYLETIYDEMVWMGDFDIMGHYDYVVRYAPYPQTCMTYRDFSDIFDEMFLYLIHEGKALEINTKSYRTYNGREVTPDTELLLRYRDLGGDIISLGSDSHDPCSVGYGFTRFAALLKSLGFRWTAHYENRRLIQLPL